ncbi:MAG: aldehyde dehydrogenase (NAD+) [Flavobacteriaceae bacterium]|jgi:aldehyde dehydrogenase (NAD+)|tara:strand:- start:15679 stop:17076 length:1398 start_codon:yes stop_codon:yes gene_type:complete
MKLKNSDTSFISSVQEEHRAFFKQHKTAGVEKRIEYLKKLKKILNRKEASIIDALYLDLKKPVFESYTSEVLMVQKELSLLIKNIKEWSTPKRVSGSLLNFPSQDFIIPEPYGTVLLISPWNYPFQLAMIPLIGAIAAGNTAVLKPSESAPHTAQILEEILTEVFSENWVKLIQGDFTVGAALLKHQWDYIFYTGSTRVGKIVAKAAAEFLTPTTLELGGKSPCIVDGTSNLKKTARRIVWGKFLNCGQTCIAPDYILVKKDYKKVLVVALIQEIEKAFGKNAEESDGYGRIIHEKHFDKLVEDLKAQNIIFGGTMARKNLYFGPTIVDEPAMESRLISDEIFGPILPILTFETEEDIDIILTKLKNPLAFYIFSSTKDFINNLIKKYSFGGGVINDSVIHFSNNNLPFGGIGTSGNGAYHGKFSFDVFTHFKPLVKRSFWFDLPQRFAPYPKSMKFLKFLLKKL